MKVSQGRKGWTANPYIWAFSTYFSEGFPYSLIRTVSSVFFRDRGASLEAIGLTSLFGLPWILKFLWAPQVDEFGTKRKWLLITQGLLAVLILATATIAPLAWSLKAVAVLFFIGSFIAATHDIAIDGYYLEALDRDGQARFVGYRVMAYRIAMMTGTGVIVTLGTTLGWFWAYLCGGLLLAALFVFHLVALPHCENEHQPLSRMWSALFRVRFLVVVSGLALGIYGLRLYLDSAHYQALKLSLPLLKRFSFASWIGLLLFLALILILVFRQPLRRMLTANPDSYYGNAFLTFMDRPRIGLILAFIIFIRTGEFMLTAMASPFMVDLGIKVHYGWISGGVGLPCSIVGAMLGGWWIARSGLKKTALPFLLAQNLTNLVYMLLALTLSGFVALNTGRADPVPIGVGNLLAVACVHGFDQFAGGLGTAVLMTYLMRICRTDYKAAHYAIGTGLMSVSGLYAGVLSGFLASWLGYGYFFGISFVLSVPGMALVLLVPFIESRDPEPHSGT